MQWPSLERPIKTGKQLLVEGRTPEIFFREWIQALGLKDQVEVRSYQSLAELTPFLRLFTSYPEFREKVTCLGIIRDAEAGMPASAFNSVCASLKAVNLQPPGVLERFSNGTPRIGVFVLPDCEASGMLETLCWEALKADAQLAAHLQCVESYVTCLQGGNIPIQNQHKTKVWTFLAAQGKYEPQVGRAAQAKVWNWQNPALAKVNTFLTSL